MNSQSSLLWDTVAAVYILPLPRTTVIKYWADESLAGLILYHLLLSARLLLRLRYKSLLEVALSK